MINFAYYYAISFVKCMEKRVKVKEEKKCAGKLKEGKGKKTQKN